MTTHHIEEITVKAIGEDIMQMLLIMAKKHTGGHLLYKKGASSYTIDTEQIFSDDFDESVLEDDEILYYIDLTGFDLRALEHQIVAGRGTSIDGELNLAYSEFLNSLEDVIDDCYSTLSDGYWVNYKEDDRLYSSTYSDEDDDGDTYKESYYENNGD